jgi:histidinol dehydrogenase
MLKTLNYNNKNSLKILEMSLDKRKLIQKNQTSVVSKIIENVKKDGDKAVLKYEKKFSKIKKNQIKYFLPTKK